MLKNYFKITIRSMLKNSSFSITNIISLAIGVACCLIILLYIMDEFSFDRYNKNADRIYRYSSKDFAMAPAEIPPLFQATHKDLIKESVRIWPMFAPAKMRYKDKLFVEKNVVFADKNIFDVFSYDVIEGKTSSALDGIDRIVLTSSMAQKYFGKESPIGKILKFWGEQFAVTAVIKNVPKNSQLRFDFIVSIATLEHDFGNLKGFGTYNYFLLAKNANINRVDSELGRFLKNSPVKTDGYRLMPLTSIHLHSKLAGEPASTNSITYIYSLATIALLILILTCINFTNLMTAESTMHAKEIGIRKTLGAFRKQLSVRFFCETIIYSFAALIIALLLLEIILPFFNQFTGKQVYLSYDNPWIIGILASVLLFVVISSGSYPALLLSGLNPIKILKSNGSAIPSTAVFRKSLLVFQIAISVGVCFAALVISYQLNYMLSKDIGFKPENVIVLDGDGYPVFKKEIMNLPSVISVTGAAQNMERDIAYTKIHTDNMPADSVKKILRMAVSYDYLKTMGIKLVSGRSFSMQFPADEKHALLLNEAAARFLGWNNPVGKDIKVNIPNEETGGVSVMQAKVIGVVRNFNYISLHHNIEPVMLYLTNDLNLTFVKLKDVNPVTISQIKTAWKKVNPDAPFNYYFLNQHLIESYKAEQKLSIIFDTFSAIAFIISAVGMLGLAMFELRRRKKELGIRKVLGASINSIVLMLSEEFGKWVIIANIIALPIAFYVMHSWLQNFAYKIEISWYFFILVAGLTFIISMLPIIYQAIKTAAVNPIKSLRYE